MTVILFLPQSRLTKSALKWQVSVPRGNSWGKRYYQQQRKIKVLLRFAQFSHHAQKKCRDFSRAPLTRGGGCGRWECEKTVGLFSLEKMKAESKSSLILHTVRVTNKKDEPRGNSNKWKLSCYQKKVLCNEGAWAACQGHLVQLYRRTFKVPVLSKCHFL